MRTKKKDIFLSIIIPFHNRVNLLFNTIDSIMKSSSNSFEIILVDDGSKKNESENVKNYIKNKNIKYFKIPNSERGYARNFGAKKAKGLYLNFFDSDDYCYDNHVIESINFAKNNNYPKIFAHSYNFKNLIKNINKRIIYKFKLNSYIFKNNILSCNSVIIQKDIFLKYKFSENKNLSGSEDWDLWLRLANDHIFLGNKIITSQIIDHNFRSTRNQNVYKEIVRLNTLKKRILNKNIINLNYKKLNLVLSEIFLFKSMVYSNNLKKKTAIINLLTKAIFLNKSNFFTKKSFLIIKKMILN